MPELSFITTCMGRFAHLQATLPALAAQPRAQCIVVDYSCPEQCGRWVEQTFPAVLVVRVEGRSRFNLGEARNAGARAAESPWLCFIDADIACDPTFTATVVARLKAGCFYRAAPMSDDRSGTVVCAREDFVRSGGYDQVMQGWGCEDLDLYKRLVLLQRVEETFPASLLQPLAHSDDLRVQHYALKQPKISCTINALYAEAKTDLMKVLGRILLLPERQQLYDSIGAWVARALESGQRVAELKVGLRAHPVTYGGNVHSALTYTLRLDGLVGSKASDG